MYTLSITFMRLHSYECHQPLTWMDSYIIFQNSRVTFYAISCSPISQQTLKSNHEINKFHLINTASTLRPDVTDCFKNVRIVEFNEMSYIESQYEQITIT